MLLRQMFFLAILLSFFSALAHAGTMTNGQWSPTNCGNKPEEPTLQSSLGGVEAYNASVLAFNEWQKAAQSYMSCLVSEANTDSVTVVKTANDEQIKLRASIDKLKTDIETLRVDSITYGPSTGSEEIQENQGFIQE
jgi:hypothetical protein